MRIEDKMVFFKRRHDGIVIIDPIVCSQKDVKFFKAVEKFIQRREGGILREDLKVISYTLNRQRLFFTVNLKTPLW